MEFEYIRKLMKNVPEEQVNEIISKLLADGMELYTKTESGSYENLRAEKTIQDLYVTAADLEHARNCVTELGMQEWLCSDQEAQVVKSPAAAAEEEYFRRRKIRLMECAVILFLGIAYFIYKSLAG